VFPLPTSVGVRYGSRDDWVAAFLGGVGKGDFRRSDERLGLLVTLLDRGFASDPRLVTDAWPVHLPGSPALPRPRFPRMRRSRVQDYPPAVHRLRL